MILTVNQINNTITGVIGTQKYTVPYTAERLTELQNYETEFSEVESLADAKAIIEKAAIIVNNLVVEDTKTKFGDYLIRDDKSNKFFLKLGDIVSTKALPQALVNMLLEALEKGMSIDPYVKCWTWFLKNPRYSDRKAQYFAKYLTTKFVDQEKRNEFIEAGYDNEQATALATFNDISITKNGLLSTYKYALIVDTKFDAESGQRIARYKSTYNEETGKATVELPVEAEDFVLMPPIMRESGDAYFAGDVLGHRIMVGQTHYLPEGAKRNTADGTFGGGGLHLGGLQYIACYNAPNHLLLNCFVNPMDILGFTDGGDGAIRNDKYFVHSACFAPNKSFYNESNYLAQGRAAWEEMAKKIVEANNKAKERIDAASAETLAL